MFIFPWHLLVLLGLLVGAGFAGRWVWRKRGSKYQALQSDIRRIERLLSAQAGAQPGSPADEDPEIAILAALKQARRSNNVEAELKLEEKLAEVRAAGEVDEPSITSPEPDALDAILRSLPNAPAKQRTALIGAAKAYGTKALEAKKDLVDALPEDVRVKLFAPARKKAAPKKKTAKKGP